MAANKESTAERTGKPTTVRVYTEYNDDVSLDMATRILKVPSNVCAIVLDEDLKIKEMQKDRLKHYIVSVENKMLMTDIHNDIRYYYNLGELIQLNPLYCIEKPSGKKMPINVYRVASGVVNEHATKISSTGIAANEVEVRRQLFIDIAEVQMYNTDKRYNAYKCACVNILSLVKGSTEADRKAEREALIKQYYSYVPMLFAYNLIEPFAKTTAYNMSLEEIKNVYESCLIGKYTHGNTNGLYKNYADCLETYDSVADVEIKNLSDFTNKFIRYLLYTNNRNLESISYIIRIADNRKLVEKYFSIYNGTKPLAEIDQREQSKVNDMKCHPVFSEPFKITSDFDTYDDSIIDSKYLTFVDLVDNVVVGGGTASSYSNTVARILSQ